jgi:ribonuclease HII
LTGTERECLFHRIVDKCIDYQFTIIDHIEIDEINILRATMKAMHDSIKKLKVKPDKFLVDGNYFKLPNNFQLSIDYEAIIDGDLKVFQISCASIIAKVIRDNIMRGYHLRYPEYNFHKHKGYSTPEHFAKIKEHGLCEIHRRSFCCREHWNYGLFEEEELYL